MWPPTPTPITSPPQIFITAGFVQEHFHGSNGSGVKFPCSCIYDIWYLIIPYDIVSHRIIYQSEYVAYAIICEQDSHHMHSLYVLIREKWIPKKWCIKHNVHQFKKGLILFYVGWLWDKQHDPFNIRNGCFMQTTYKMYIHQIHGLIGAWRRIYVSVLWIKWPRL